MPSSWHCLSGKIKLLFPLFWNKHKNHHVYLIHSLNWQLAWKDCSYIWQRPLYLNIPTPSIIIVYHICMLLQYYRKKVNISLIYYFTSSRASDLHFKNLKKKPAVATRGLWNSETYLVIPESRHFKTPMSLNFIDMKIATNVW